MPAYAAPVAVRHPGADEVEDRGRAPAGRRSRRRLALAVGGGLTVVLAAAWLERRPIARHFVDNSLASAGVAARYRLADLGPGRQRLTDVVIGDPAHPDLVADWIETRTTLGLGGPVLAGVRAGRVRVRARWVDGHLSLGAIDRLLPAGNGKPARLPALALDLADARLRLETPAGVIGVGLSGRGRLDDGFVGRAALAATTLASGGCTLAGVHATVRVRTRRGAVALTGPVAGDRLACGATRLANPRLALDALVDPAASTWRGKAQLTAGALVDPHARAASLAGAISFAGRPGATTGTITLAAGQVVTAGGRAGRVVADGRFVVGGQSRFDGSLAVADASVDRGALLALRQGVQGVAGTPIGPLATRAADAIEAAARSLAGSIEVHLAGGPGGVRGAIGRGVVASPGGATLRFDGTATLAGAIDGSVSVTGGGLPTLAATLRRGSATVPVTGVLTAQPYRAGDATLALSPGSFAVGRDGGLRLATVATLSGPLGDGGAVEALRLPLALRRDGHRDMRIDEACTPVAARRLMLGGLRLEAVRLTLCPLGDALVRVDRGIVSGGMRLGATRLAGRLGGSPLAVAARGATVTIASRGFALDGVAVSLGPAARQTRVAAAALTGTLTGAGAAGGFAGAAGRIGAVPLALSGAAGRWSVANGVLGLAGALTVADAQVAAAACPPVADQPPPRFCPMLARDVALRLADGRIAATATLAEPTTGTRVAGLSLAHNLGSGTGSADLAIDALAFRPGFQPDLLTPLTKGVVADVAGTIDGRGHIAWSDAGLTSRGRFATAGTDLAAAFGPVTGIAGAIEFTDLLGLVSAAGQQLSVASINPGIAVAKGVVRFHTEAGPKVAVESARWPFAGGTLTLDPTLLDFAAPAERHLTFRLDGVAADRFLQQFDYRNLAATGVFDGALPMIFDARGGRIEGGRLTMREGGGTIAYVGDLAQKDLGFWGNLAFQALKSLRYRSLGIAMDGPLEGEMVTQVHFAGVSQGVGAKSNFLIRRLQRLPFVFNVRITAPFRELVQTGSSFSDPRDLLRRSVPALLAPAPVPAAVPAGTVQLGSSVDVPEAKRP